MPGAKKGDLRGHFTVQDGQAKRRSKSAPPGTVEDSRGGQHVVVIDGKVSRANGRRDAELRAQNAIQTGRGTSASAALRIGDTATGLPLFKEVVRLVPSDERTQERKT